MKRRKEHIATINWGTFFCSYFMICKVMGYKKAKDSRDQIYEMRSGLLQFTGAYKKWRYFRRHRRSVNKTDMFTGWDSDCGSGPLTDFSSVRQIREWMCYSGGMIMAGGNRNTRRKTCPSATVSTTNPTLAGRDENSGLRGEKPDTGHLSDVRQFC
jgi:hypothetical protein